MANISLDHSAKIIIIMEDYLEVKIHSLLVIYTVMFSNLVGIFEWKNYGVSPTQLYYHSFCFVF